MSKPFELDVSSCYGAPMGRYEDKLEDFEGKAHLQRVPFVDGDYDKGGAYWGGGRDTPPLFCAWDDEGHARYVRAVNREAAKAQFPGLKFYR